MASRNKKAMGVAIIAGLLLLLAGINGVATWEKIGNFVKDDLGMDNEAVHIIFAILILIASLGGIAVIIGGLLIGKNKVRSGKLLITIGVGLGIIGLIFTLWMAYSQGNLTMNSLMSIGFVGIILSIIARFMPEKK